MKSRICWFIVSVWSGLVLPWWLTLAILIWLVAHYRNYYESIVVGIMFDLLYGAPGVGWLGFQFSTTVLLVGLLVFAEAARVNLAWHKV